MSRSPERPLEDPLDRRMSFSSNHSRPEADEAPAKRMRTDARVEDKARGKRLFGNILGTLQKFKKEDKTSRTSEAAKRREQVSERIASKIRSETNLHHEIAEKEKELKSLRIGTDSAEYILKHKEVAMSARHASLKPTSKFLHTSLPPSVPPIFEGNLLNPSPIPLNQGPSREPPHPHQLKPLYFLPKILLPEQEAELSTRIINIDELIADEAAALVKEKEETIATARSNRAQIEELTSRLAELRKQVKPLEIRGRADTVESIRTRRETSERDRDGMEVEKEDTRDAREAGVQITGEDGDVEVEY